MTPGIWNILKQDPESDLFWYWLPGWSFTPAVYAELAKQLPGTHLGLDYPTLYNGLYNPMKADETAPQFSDAVHKIISQTARPGHWVGWSLGGALARAVCSRLQTQSASPSQNQSPSQASKVQPLSLTTMATGNTFLQYNVDEPGMAADVFFNFCRSFDKMPAKTLKRFLALCCQGATANGENIQRELATGLLRYQIAGDADREAMLSTSLQWLTQYKLNSQYPLAEGFRSTAIYASDDALKPGGLKATNVMTAGHSHALIAEADAKQVILQQLGTLHG